jgi:hypothetical protein
MLSMARLKTVDNLISDVRSLCDESSGALNDLTDIIPSLNRAQTYAFNILARQYPDPLIEHAVLTLTGGVSEYDIPENIFEDRLEKVEIFDGQYYSECTRISYRNGTLLDSPQSTARPYEFMIIGRKIRFLQPPTGAYNARIWYLREPDSLVTSQGRVSSVGSDYVIVDDIGDDLSTVEDALANYVNVIDGQTGIIKQTLQIGNIAGNKITFRSVLTRSSDPYVVNRLIDTSVDIDVELDDYICGVEGSCVPFFTYPIYNFMVEYTVAEMKRKLGGTSDMEERVKKAFEAQIEHSWTNRETTYRVKRTSRAWRIGRTSIYR